MPLAGEGWGQEERGWGIFSWENYFAGNNFDKDVMCSVGALDMCGGEKGSLSNMLRWCYWMVVAITAITYFK